MYVDKIVQSTEVGMQSAEVGVQSAEVGVQSAEVGVQSAEVGVQSNCESREMYNNHSHQRKKYHTNKL